jgi:hypothetical protein
LDHGETGWRPEYNDHYLRRVDGSSRACGPVGTAWKLLLFMINGESDP